MRGFVVVVGCAAAVWAVAACPEVGPLDTPLQSDTLVGVWSGGGARLNADKDAVHIGVQCEEISTDRPMATDRSGAFVLGGALRKFGGPPSPKDLMSPFPVGVDGKIQGAEPNRSLRIIVWPNVERSPGAPLSWADTFDLKEGVDAVPPPCA